jgi:CheY-like chemotaxis protein
MAIERTQAKEELIKAKDEAEEMNRLKTSFLANMSHELRTPMVGILGYTEILKKEIADPELREMSGEIFNSANRLLGTLNLILDLSKIEANKSEIKPTETNIGEITVNQVKCFEELARKKNLYLKTIIVDEHIYALLDERIFRQVINNLVSNAIKFTDKGSITVIVDKKQSGSKEGVAITVIDSGIGIPQESQQLIFEEFRQVSEGLDRVFEGSGLGLSITKRFVELMNGEISVESEVGKGSVFTVRFPLYRKEGKNYETVLREKETTLQNNSEKKYKAQLPDVLLVEDDPSNAGVIKYFLKDVCSLDIANTGEQALKMTSTKQYSAILMDIDLGRGMSGIEATKRIRKMEGYENLPIVAVTALAMKGQKELFLSEGCSHYISKPFESKVFVSFIRGIIFNGKPGE